MNWKEVKLCLFSDNMGAYIESPKESTKKLLELISSSASFQDIRSICEYWLYFYIVAIDKPKMKFGKQLHIIAPKIVKLLWINLTKEVENLYSKNYKTLWKKLRKT